MPPEAAAWSDVRVAPPISGTLPNSAGVPRRGARPLAPVAAPPPDRAEAEARRSEPSEAASLTDTRLFAEYAGLVRQIASGFQRRLPRNVLRDDLVAAGMSGLWDAIRRHQGERTGSFDWYVRTRIRGAILDELRAQDWLPRRARAAADRAVAEGSADATPVVLRFDEVSEAEQARCLAGADSSRSDQLLEDRLAREMLVRAMEQLPDRERHIVSLHYFSGVKFKDLGRMFGVSVPRISQLHARAMERLRAFLRPAA